MPSSFAVTILYCCWYLLYNFSPSSLLFLRCSSLLCLFLSFSCVASLLPSCSTTLTVTASLPSQERPKLHHNSTRRLRSAQSAAPRLELWHQNAQQTWQHSSLCNSFSPTPTTLLPYPYPSSTLNFVNTGQVNPNLSLSLSNSLMWHMAKS